MAFEEGLTLKDCHEHYSSSEDLELIRPMEEINSFDGLKLTVENASFDDVTDMNDSDNNSSVASVAPSTGGLVAKVVRSNYHSPAMLRKHEPLRPTQFARRGSAVSEMESDSSKEDFSTDFSTNFSTEEAEPQYCELKG